MPKLIVSFPEGSPTTHELTEENITVGRIAENDLQIEDISVSSRHAILTLVHGDYVLRDTGSTNGTRLNGQELEPETDHRLQDGDVVLFGKVETSYQSTTPAEARPLPAEQDAAVVTAAESVRPADFSNASPFQTKTKKKDPAGKAILALSIVAIVAFVASVAAVFSVRSPL